jgi:hypothetical protein
MKFMPQQQELLLINKNLLKLSELLKKRTTNYNIEQENALTKTTAITKKPHKEMKKEKLLLKSLLSLKLNSI